MADLIFSFRDITIRNYGATIFEGLDFSMRKGEHWALVGRSGSGKTAFLDAVAGKLSLAKGSASFFFYEDYIAVHQINDPLFNRFRLIAQISSRHHFRNLSHTTDFYYQQRFNSTDSEDSDTVGEYLAAIEKHQNPGPWTFKRVVEMLKLNNLLDKQLIKLSNGETKRLLIAAALVKNPLLLLMDNPLTGLDVSTRREFDEILAEIAGSGISVIMATSGNEIPDIVTCIGIFDSGKMKQVQRSDFDPAEVPVSQPGFTDTDELEKLLSISDIPSYDVIASMEDVTIRYGDKLILDRVNWKIRQEERWMLLGANGAGKSTLLSLINGDNPQAFANRIVLFDRKKGAGESIWEIKKNIGFVSPELFQYFPMESSCIQVIESGFYDTMGLFRKSGEAKAELCLRWMRLLEIDEHSNTLFKNVSISVQRLCLLARALVKNPALLILDEPCQGLDHAQQDRFKSLIDEICQRSRVSLIYVSHYADERPEAVNQTLLLEQGRVKG